jgi:lipoprotein NlpD
VIAGYSDRGRINKGIDIAGKPGDAVRSAAAGKVVYAGSGLKGYGKLLIIRHNNDYLSAYAHNQRLLVKEGQMVKAGAVIAELGASGTDRPKLHFEIRRQGKPLNPLKLLPPMG